MATIEDLADEQALAIVSRHHLRDDLFKAKVKSALHSLKATIESLPPVKGKSFTSDFFQHSFSDPTATLSAIKLLKAPGKISLIGSHILGIQTAHSANADLYLEAPESFYVKEDLFDAKYHKKRFIYLCYVAEGIRKANPEFVVSFLETKSLRPSLQVAPDDSFSIRIHIGVKSSEEFSIDHLNCNSQLLTEPFFNSDLSVPRVPTPHYSNSIVQDFLFLDHLSFLHSCMKEVENLQSACILLKAWLRQKEIFMNFVYTMLACSLCQRGFIQRPSSTFKIFAQILKFLSENSKTYLNESPEDGANFGESALFLDPTGRLNLLDQVEHGMLSYVSQEARQTLGLLAVYSVYPERAFGQIFCQEPPLFDLEIRLGCPDIMNIGLFNSKRFLAMLGASGDRIRTIMFWLPWMLNKALSDRISCIRCELIGGKVVLRLRYASEATASDPILRGPLTEEKEQAAFFRALWGSLAELKRYPNGSIHEVVHCPSDERFPVYFLASHLLQRHASIPANQIELQLKFDFPCTSVLSGSRIPTDVKEAFGQFHQFLKDTPEIAAILDNLLPLSSCFRGTMLEVPQRVNQRPRTNSDRSLQNAAIPIIIGIQFQQTRSFERSLRATESSDICTSLKYTNLYKLYQYLCSHRYLCSFASDPSLDVEYCGFLFRIIPLPGDSDWSGVHAHRMATLTAAHFVSNPLYSQLVTIFKQWLDCNLLLSCLNDPLEVIPELVVCRFIFERYALVDNYSLHRLTWEFFRSLSQFLNANVFVESGSFLMLQREYTPESTWISSIAQSLSKCTPYLKTWLPGQLERRRILHLASQIGKELFVPMLGDFDLVLGKVCLGATVISSPIISKIDLHREAVEMVRKEFGKCLFFTSSTHLGIVLGAAGADGQQITSRLSKFYRPIRR